MTGGGPRSQCVHNPLSMVFQVQRIAMDGRISVAIDGPAGAGKTTVAREVARRLGYKYVDSGAMYRAVAWKSLELGVSPSDESAMTHVSGAMRIDFGGRDGSHILVDGTDVSKAIRTPEVTKLSSPVSAISGVRKHLVARQRQLAEGGGVVMEGRDIGSVVLPDAEVKVFLTASADERAKRRHAEMQAAGVDVDIGKLKGEIEERDRRDSTREHSPLVRVPDAAVIDTDGETVDQVVEKILTLCRERM